MPGAVQCDVFQGRGKYFVQLFIGVPTPAGAFLIFLPLVLDLKGYLPASSIFTALYMTLIAFLMISHIKTPSNRLLSVSKKLAPLAAVAVAGVVAGFVYATLDTYLLTVVAYLAATLFLFFNDKVYRHTEH